MTCYWREEQYSSVSLNHNQKICSQKCLAHSFANITFEGKTKAAIRLLTEEAKGEMFRLSDHVDTNRE